MKLKTQNTCHLFIPCRYFQIEKGNLPRAWLSWNQARNNFNWQNLFKLEYKSSLEYFFKQNEFRKLSILHLLGGFCLHILWCSLQSPSFSPSLCFPRWLLHRPEQLWQWQQQQLAPEVLPTVWVYAWGESAVALFSVWGSRIELCLYTKCAAHGKPKQIHLKLVLSNLLSLTLLSSPLQVLCRIHCWQCLRKWNQCRNEEHVRSKLLLLP